VPLKARVQFIVSAYVFLVVLHLGLIVCGRCTVGQRRKAVEEHLFLNWKISYDVVHAVYVSSMMTRTKHMVIL
jgi:hypothetical protein